VLWSTIADPKWHRHESVKFNAQVEACVTHLNNPAKARMPRLTMFMEEQ